MQLSTGPWSYNRFEAFEKTLTEGKKPDFLDVDKDGDKKESFKKALKDKDEKKDVKEGSMPPWLKDKEGDDKKESKKSPCEKCKAEGKKDCKCDDDKTVKEHVIESLLADGLANNQVSAEIIAEHMSPEWVDAILND